MHSALDQAQSLVSGLYDAAALLDLELHVRFYNSSYAAMTRLRPRALRIKQDEGARAMDFLATNAEKDCERARACISAAEPLHLAEQLVGNTAGDVFTTWMSFLPVLDAEKKVIGLIQIIRDVTGEARAHAHLKESLASAKARADELERAVEQRTRELTIALDSVTRLSRTDPLTGLLNRRSFTDQAEQAIDLAKRHRRGLALMMCDLDHFKRVNDSHGHQAGDALLAATAKALVASVRDADRVARFGGEEFGILLSETSAASVVQVAERGLEAVRQLPINEIIPGATRKQTISIGVAVFPDHGATLEELVASADEALYCAKEGGRDRSVIYEGGMSQDVAGSPYIRQRVLLLDPDERRLSEAESALGAMYDITSVASAERGLSLLRHGHFDALVATQELPDGSGVEFLGKALAVMPSAFRVLSVEGENFLLALQATNHARVDFFFQRNEPSAKLLDVIGDGLARRDVMRDHLLAGRTLSRQTYVLGMRELERILHDRTLAYAYQPIVCSTQYTHFAYEVLCRPPTYFRLGPSELFETAVRSGEIWRLSRLGRCAISESMGRFPSDAALFVNMHPAEIDDPELLLPGCPLQSFAKRIVFEITERGAISDFEDFKSRMRELRDRGYRFAIDDLGAGYAGLSSVALLDPEFLKIDMSMIREIDRSSRRANLVRRLVEYGNDQGIRIVAEGVETAGEARVAAEVGCHFLQGFFFGTPKMFGVNAGAAAPAEVSSVASVPSVSVASNVSVAGK